MEETGDLFDANFLSLVPTVIIIIWSWMEGVRIPKKRGEKRER